MHRTEANNNLNGLFQDGPPGTPVTADMLNAIQEEIAGVVEGAGLTLQSKDTDTRDQMWQAIAGLLAPYDALIATQTQFGNIIERTGANTYQIKDDFNSIYVKELTGGYQIPLSGGDAWGILQTNNAKNILFEVGAFIAIGALKNYIEVNTDDCHLQNVEIRGNSSQGSLEQAFLLNAERVFYENCKVKNIQSDFAFAMFKGSSTDLHNISSKYQSCIVDNITGAGSTNKLISGFKTCQNLSNCIVTNFISDNTGTSRTYCFNTCINLSNCVVKIIENTGDSSGDAFGFWTCTNLSSCVAEQIDDAVSGGVVGFVSCTNLSACLAQDLDCNVSVKGYSGCNNLSSCRATDIECSGASVVIGFTGCDRISGCSATNIVSGGGQEKGFNDCNYISSAYTDTTINDANDFVDTADASITNKNSTGGWWT